ncbi:DUF4294 domain-containing protein [Flavicella sediminum]|uniref:DUF4294 domain-containing protein n=1 Tax=Flavicella sediminum TaxID=2585141 RepID=UPI001122074F|nr:DUF4294 domain-containing protein [Flavicella sediminum]
MKKNCFYLFIFLTSFAFAQDKDSLDLSKYTLFTGDTLMVNLQEVQLMKKLTFKTYNDKRYYYWFRKKVLRAYPYAKLASERLEILNNRLDSIDSKRKKKRYIKRIHKYMEKEFTEQLKKLTRTEGRILIKLIHRETGRVTYDLVKDYRSGWKAFWYNTTANLFKLSLKTPYDPENIREDYMIEDILQRAWRDNLIELKASKLDFNYFDVKNKFEFIYPKK